MMTFRSLFTLALAPLAATALGLALAGAPVAGAQDRGRASAQPRRGPATSRGALRDDTDRGRAPSEAPSPDIILGDAYFTICDYDENGWISFREASQALAISRPRFFAFDRNRDGRVVRDEFLAIYRDTVQRLGAFQPPTPREGTLAEALPDSIAPAASGEALIRAASVAELFGQPVSREDAELISPLPPRVPGPVPHFLRLDLDRDGLISPADLHALSRPVQLPVRINTVIATLDLDGNGGVDADELRRSMQNN